MSLLITSCEREFLNTNPESTISEDQLATSPNAQQGVLNGIYTSLHTYGMTSAAGHEDFGHKAVLSGMDLMSNDVLQTKHHWFGFYYNYQGRIQTSSRPRMIWKTYYQQIKAANSVIEAAEKTGITSENKNQYGQALALRGYFYFMLARIFSPTYVGNTDKLCVPVYTKNTLEGNARSTVEEVYAQIVSDIETGIINLDGFIRNKKEKVDKSVAQAFLAQVYLEMGEYAKAASMANAARSGYAQPTEAQWKDGFYDLKASPDAMWGGIVTADSSPFVASFFGHFDNTDTNGYAGGLLVYKSIDKRLYDAMPDTDYRKSVFIPAKGTAPYKALPKYANIKFRDQTAVAAGGIGQEGDDIYLRASEMYYIEAEALARIGNEAQAKAVLSEIALLRNPSYSTSATGSALITEIILQKRIEMWGEGCAFFDMKRLGIGLDRNYAGTNHVVASGKLTIPAGSKEFVFQIPEAEILANPLVVQNP